MVDSDKERLTAEKLGVGITGESWCNVVRTAWTSRIGNCSAAPGRADRKLEFVGEAALARGFAQLMTDQRQVVYVLTGHGDLDPGERGPGGLSELAQALDQERYDVETLDLLRSDREGGLPTVPDDAAVVFVARPQQPLTPQEEDSLLAWIGRGGAVLFAVDVGSPVPALLGRMGLTVPEGVALQPEMQVPYRDRPIPLYKRHAITMELLEEKVVSVLAHPAPLRMVDPLPEGPGFTGAVQHPGRLDRRGGSLVGGGAIYEKDIDGAGPVDLAIALELLPGRGLVRSSKPVSRILVVGDGDLFTMPSSGKRPGMPTLALNAIHWLAGEDRRLGVTVGTVGRATRSRRLALTQEELGMLRIVTLGFMPFVVLLFGIGTWVARRADEGLPWDASCSRDAGSRGAGVVRRQAGHPLGVRRVRAPASSSSRSTRSSGSRWSSPRGCGRPRRAGWPMDHRGNGFEAGRSMVNRVKHQLHDLTARATVVEAPDAPELYGLGENAIRVQLTLRDGETLGFRAGDPNPSSVSYYIQPEPGDTVYTVKKSAVDYYSLTLDEFRERRFATFDGKDVNRFGSPVHRGGSGAAGCRTHGDRQWQLHAPVEMGANDDRVRRLIGRVNALKARISSRCRRDERASRFARWGSMNRVPTSRCGSGREPLRVRVGADAPTSNRFEELAYMRLDEEDTVYVARRGILDEFTQDPAELRNRRVVEMRAADVTAVDALLVPDGDDDLAGEHGVRFAAERWFWADGVPFAGSTAERVARVFRNWRWMSSCPTLRRDLLRMAWSPPSRVVLSDENGNEKVVRSGPRATRSSTPRATPSPSLRHH